MNSKDILEHKKGFRAKKYNKKYIDPMKKSDTMIEPDKPKNQKKDESTSMKTTVSEYKGKTDQERIDAFRKQAKDLKDKGFVKAADDTEKLSKTLYKKKDKAVAEGAKWRNHPDAYNVDDEGNKTPRNPNSPKFGYDPLQRRADTANDAKTSRGKTAALKTSLKMAQGNKGVAEGYILKKTNVSKYMKPGDPDEYTQDVNVKDTDYEIINNKTGQVVGTASWTTNDFFGPGALKITLKNGATRWLDIWEREKGNPQSAFNRFVKDPKTSKKYKDEQGVAEGSGAKYKVKSIGKDNKGEYHISPSTGKKVYKSGANKGDHENPKTGEIKKSVAEAGSANQQAAIAIAMKKSGKKPKNVEEAKYQKVSAQQKFKNSMKRAGYDMDAGAKRLQDLLDRQKKEREEKEKKDVAEGKWSNDDWGDMSKREFKRREMEHELGHEVEPRREKPKGMYFYTVPPMDLFKAKSLGLRQSRSGKWYSTRPNPQADKEFGPGKYWEPKSEGVAEAKEEKVPQKPRQGPLRPQTGAGKHKDKKKAQKQGQEKHKKPLAEAIMDSMLSELDKPSGKLYIVLKPDNTDNVRMVGAFANSPEEVEHIAARHGLKDKKGAKMKGLKIDLLFTDAADALMDLKRAFKDIDFVGAEQAEFVFKSSLFRNTEIDPRVAEEVREFKDYIESGDDPQMAKYQEKNVGDEPERKASGVDHFVIGPDGKRRRVAIPGKPNAQMGGHATEQPNVFRYILNRTELMPKLRDMGFKFDGNQIILNQKQRDMLMAKLGPQFQQIFGKKDTFKEATGDPVGKITKVDPATKKATISKPDGTSQEVDSTSLKTTADGKLAMDSPDQSQLTNKEVVSTEDALAPPNDSRSPIHGDEDHDEMSKLLVHRLRRLAGLEEQEPAASSVPPDLTVNGVLSDPEISPQDREAMKQLLVANPDGTVNIQGSLRNVSGELIRMLPQLTDIFKELLQDANAFVRTPEFAKLGPQDQTAVITMTKELPALIQKMDQQIMSMAQTHDQGFNKLDRQTGQYGDGQVEESDWTVPIGGLSQKQDLATGHTTTRYQAGPMDISQTKDAKGNVIGHDSSYRMGRDATIRAQRPVGSQITTMTGQANTPDAQADVDNILGVQGAADRKKVDPQKFAQFQRQMPKESAELEAMLRIAGLR